MVFVGVGGVFYEQFVEMVDKYFVGFFFKSFEFVVYFLFKKKVDFIGFDVRICDDIIFIVNIVIVVEGVSWNDFDYFIVFVIQVIVGNYDKVFGNVFYQGSKFSGIVYKNDFVISYMSFFISYSDIGYGLFCYVVCEG